MGWWEQIQTFDTPENGFVHNGGCDSGGVASQSTTHVKQGTYAYKKATANGDTRNSGFTHDDRGYDLSSYPPSAYLCLWLYISDITKWDSSTSTGVNGGAFRVFFQHRPSHESANMMRKTYYRSELANGWNFLTVPLQDMTNYSSRYAQDITGFGHGHAITSGNEDYWIDDIYISTDKTKDSYPTEGTYTIKTFERYDTTNARNTEYIGTMDNILHFEYSRELNAVGEATITVRGDWDDFPQFRDIVRIYRNGMCVWDGVVIDKEWDREAGTSTLTCWEANYVMKELLDYSAMDYYETTATHGHLYIALAYLTWAADNYGTGVVAPQGYGLVANWSQQPTYWDYASYVMITKEEMCHPWELLEKYQQEQTFDFEMRPNFATCLWYPQKGRTLPVKLFERQHFKPPKLIYKGADLATYVRAYTRGAGVASVQDAYDGPSVDTYSHIVKQLNTDSKTSADALLAAQKYRDIYKSPALIFNELELLPGGYIWPWDLGDSLTCVVNDTEYSKRIYAIKAAVTQDDENIKLVMQ